MNVTDVGYGYDDDDDNDDDSDSDATYFIKRRLRKHI